MRTRARAVDVLDAERDAAKLRRVALGEAAVGVVGLRHRFGRAHRDERVDARLNRGDPLEASAGRLARGDSRRRRRSRASVIVSRLSSEATSLNNLTQ